MQKAASSFATLTNTIPKPIHPIRPPSLHVDLNSNKQPACISSQAVTAILPSISLVGHVAVQASRKSPRGLPHMSAKLLMDSAAVSPSANLTCSSLARKGAMRPRQPTMKCRPPSDECILHSSIPSGMAELITCASCLAPSLRSALHSLAHCRMLCRACISLAR
ncbi:hypothetical protein LZ32DRAFT_420634 [Colletotrichum eremochloae]|nr:hypothetical protein LZ32DRAFT_420634 [Colletotrichum eremochloae]